MTVASNIAKSPSSGAIVCRRGHVVRPFVDDPRLAGGRCDDCGAKLLVACEACGYRIRGAASAIARDYKKPSFCDGCGTVFPWTGRRQRLQHVQNLVDDSLLDPATKLEVVELLGSLLEREVEDSERQWTRILTIAPQLWTSAAHSTLVAVVPAAVKARLGLHA